MASKAHKDYRAKVDALTPTQRARRVWVENADGVRTTVTYARAIFMEYRGEGRICSAPPGTGKAPRAAAADADAPAELVGCKSCGDLIAPSARFCAHCGASQVEVVKPRIEADAEHEAELGAGEMFDGQPWPTDDDGNPIPAVDDAGAPVPNFAAMKWHQVQAWIAHAGLPPMKKAEAIGALMRHYGVGTVG